MLTHIEIHWYRQHGKFEYCKDWPGCVTWGNIKLHGIRLRENRTDGWGQIARNRKPTGWGQIAHKPRCTTEFTAQTHILVPPACVNSACMRVHIKWGISKKKENRDNAIWWRSEPSTGHEYIEGQGEKGTRQRGQEDREQETGRGKEQKVRKQRRQSRPRRGGKKESTHSKKKNKRKSTITQHKQRGGGSMNKEYIKTTKWKREGSTIERTNTQDYPIWNQKEATKQITIQF